MNDELSTIELSPKYVGYWVLSEHVHFAAYKKPNWFNRKMMKLILGFEWKDIE